MRSKLSAVLASLLMLFAVSLAAPLARPAAASPGHATAADLRATLTSLLTEHVVLAASATGAALGGRDDEFQAAAAALDENTVELSQAIGSVYGPEAEESFLPLWRAHIGFFVDYAQGVAAGDQAKADKAVEDLNGYVADAAAFFSGANPNLPNDAVADLLTTHVLGLKAAVDAQASGDATTAYASLREGYAHSGMIADALAGGIVQQFPEQFGVNTGAGTGGTVTAPAEMPAAMPQTGIGDEIPVVLYIVGAIALVAVGMALMKRSSVSSER